MFQLFSSDWLPCTTCPQRISHFLTTSLPNCSPASCMQVDTAVTTLEDIWAKKIIASIPVTYAKSAIAMAPAKVEELKAVSN